MLLFFMKKSVCVSLLLLIVSLGLVSANINVENVSLRDRYVTGDVVAGTFILQTSNQDYTSTFSTSEGEELDLGEFILRNGGNYTCNPADCSSGYSASNGEASKEFSVLSTNDERTFGFYLQGEDVDISSISFDIESDFEEEVFVPLTINYFDGGNYFFKEFSNSLSEKDYGCYDESKGEVGPLIRSSSYCEEISLPESDKYFVGVDVELLDDKDLKMTIYTDDDLGFSLDNCEFNPNDEEGCLMNALPGDVFASGVYTICVSGLEETDYKIYTEEEGATCGFSYSNRDEQDKDYAIFAQFAKYASADSLQLSSVIFEDMVSEANEMLGLKYNNNCSAGCALPIVFSGIQQIINISNLQLDYVSDGEDFVVQDFYDVEEDSAKIDFSGVADISLARFNVTDGKMAFYVDGTRLFDKEMILLESPVVSSITPRNPPVGVPLNFYASLEKEGWDNLVYEWDFGDGVEEITYTNEVRHTYSNLTNMTMKVKVSSGNLSTTRSFVISPISPEEAVNYTIDLMRGYLDKIETRLSSFPFWYKDELSDEINLTLYDDELSRLERDLQNAFEEQDYIDIAEKLFAIDFPTTVYVSEEISGPLLTSIEGIDPSPVQVLAGGSAESLTSYKNPILRWQMENVQSTINHQLVSLRFFSGREEDIMRVYDASITVSESGESFIIINKPFADLFFNDGAGERKAGDVAGIITDSGVQNNFEFYYFGSDEASIYVSPKLSRLPIDAVIGVCNFNYVCQEDLGENPDNCRTDCKPVGSLIFWMIILFLIALIVYTLLQVWYKSKYETYLFKDRKHLFNLLMFISNARAKGFSDEQIREMLKKKGWNNEQISYALKKSRGERTGMYEIVPVEKLFAYYRDFKEKKKVDKNPRAKPEFKPVANVQPQRVRKGFPPRGLPQRGIGGKGFVKRK